MATTGGGPATSTPGELLSMASSSSSSTMSSWGGDSFCWPAVGGTAAASDAPVPSAAPSSSCPSRLLLPASCGRLLLGTGSRLLLEGAKGIVGEPSSSLPARTTVSSSMPAPGISTADELAPAQTHTQQHARTCSDTCTLLRRLRTDLLSMLVLRPVQGRHRAYTVTSRRDTHEGCCKGKDLLQHVKAA
jgi:hypothetical protein